MKGTIMSSDEKILKWLNDDIEDNIVEKPEAPPRKSYKKRIVAWLDILGIRAKIKNEKDYDAERIINIMSTLATYVKSSCDKLSLQGVLDYSQIADGFMIVADIEYADQICSILAEIQWKILINMKMLSRGAITAGNVSVSSQDNLIIGPAYVDAYAMESEYAIYARTIISNEFLNETKHYLSFEYIKEDSDKTAYIDYIGYIMNSQLIDSNRMKKILAQQGVIKELKNNYTIKSSTKLSILQKYGWTIALLDRNNIKII